MVQYIEHHDNCKIANTTFGPFYFGHWNGVRRVKFNSSIMINETTYNLDFPPVQVLWQSLWSYTKYYSLPGFTNSTFTKDSILENSFCRPANTYQWGFASLLLFTFCVMTVMFVLIVTALRCDVYWNSRAGRLKSNISIYRDAMDLAIELQAQFGERAVELSARELEEHIQGQKGAVSLQTVDLPLARWSEHKLRRARR